MVLLAKVVHDYSPIYGLFDNQCYMYASVMFDSLVRLYSSPTTASTPVLSASNGGVVKNENVVFLPTPASDQAQLGHWLGILIVDPRVKAAIVSIMVSHFQKERVSYMEKFL